MVITTFEMILADCPELKKIQWRCVVIDEAHRLKNRNCKLLEGLKLMALVSTSCPGSPWRRVGWGWPCLAVRCHCQQLRPCARLEENHPEGPLMDGALVPCSPHKLLFARVEYYLPLCLPTWEHSLPEPCPSLQPSVSCCSTWGQLLPCTIPLAMLCLVPYIGQGCDVQDSFLLLCKHVPPCQGWVNKGINDLL